MPFADRASHRIHYETLGDPSKPPLLLVMGLAVSSKAWDQLPHCLAEDFHVLVFDNRGTGKSTRNGWAYRMAALADDAAAVLDAAGIAKAHVFGISMGGMIAQELALRHPERIDKLVLGATFASFRKGHRAPLSSVWDLLLLNLGFKSEDRFARLLISSEWHAKNPGKGVAWMKNNEQTSLRFALAQSAAILRHHTAPRLAQIRAPTLVITGDADRLVVPANSEVLARSIPNARLVKLPGAGHVFPLEQERETVAALRAFLKPNGAH